jgi:hypothetical protein
VNRRRAQGATLYTLTHYSRTSRTPQRLDLTNLPPIAPSWHELADQAVEQAREIFERAWEVTEHPLQHSARRCWKRSYAYLGSGWHRVKSQIEEYSWATWPAKNQIQMSRRAEEDLNVKTGLPEHFLNFFHNGAYAARAGFHIRRPDTRCARQQRVRARGT